MNTKLLKEHLNHFETTCRTHGLRLTRQKLGIYEILLKSETHPKADEIFFLLKKNYPKVSFATVYDNLRKFKQYGLIQELNTEEGASRYEANMSQHHHAIDSKTGEIMDVHLSGTQQIPIPDVLKNKNIKEIKVTYVL